MEKIAVHDTHKAQNFLRHIINEIDDLSSKHKEMKVQRLFETSVMPEVVKHIDFLASNNSLMERVAANTITIYLGRHLVEVPGYVWRGAGYFEYPFIREIEAYKNILKENTIQVKVPAFVKLCQNYIGYSNRKTTKVFLLNFPEFKPVANLRCKIPSISPSNWYRHEALTGRTRDEIKEMQDELQSVLSLLIL